MTAFTKENLIKDGAYIFYVGNGKREFVARFKYQANAMGSFMTFLRKNFTVEEYFAEKNAGVAPLTIAESKGYLLPHIKKQLKLKGYPQTKAGFEQLIADQIAARKAAA